MEESSSPKVCDQSLGSDGCSPFASTSTSEDSSCGEFSPEKNKALAADDATESPLGGDKQSSPIAQLMERTGYSIVQQNGQRRYGPPPDWEGQPPSRGCEVFVGKIPRDCFEDELVPVFDRMGKIYEMRLMMDYTGQNRGYAFVVYGDVSSAKESVRQLNNFEIRKGRTLGVCMSVDNCRLFVGGIPKKVRYSLLKRGVGHVYICIFLCSAFAQLQLMLHTAALPPAYLTRSLHWWNVENSCMYMARACPPRTSLG